MTAESLLCQGKHLLASRLSFWCRRRGRLLRFGDGEIEFLNGDLEGIERTAEVFGVADGDNGEVLRLQILTGDTKHVGAADALDGLLVAENEVARVAEVVIGDKAVER